MSADSLKLYDKYLIDDNKYPYVLVDKYENYGVFYSMLNKQTYSMQYTTHKIKPYVEPREFWIGLPPEKISAPIEVYSTKPWFIRHWGHTPEILIHVREVVKE